MSLTDDITGIAMVFCAEKLKWGLTESEKCLMIRLAVSIHEESSVLKGLG